MVQLFLGMLEIQQKGQGEVRSSLTRQDIKNYDAFITTPVPEAELARIRDLSLRHALSLREHRQQTPIEELQATGEHPFASTQYDAAKNPQPIPLEEETEVLTERHVYLSALTHPTPLATYRMIQQQRPFTRIQKSAPVIDEGIKDRDAFTFIDFGPGMAEESYDDPTVVISAKEILGIGMPVWLTNDTLVAAPFIASSMPAVISAPALATLTIAGSTGFIPIDAMHRDIANQQRMAARTRELIETDPLLLQHPERDFLIERAQRLLGATLKADPANAVRRVKELMQEGVCTYRIYDARSGIRRMVDTVSALKDAYGDSITILAGQIGGPLHAQALQAAGANGLIVGKADGAVCSTGEVSGTVPNNLYTLYKSVNTGIDLPIWVDGAKRSIVALALGAGVMASRSLIGGTYEQPAVGYWYDTPEGRGKPYDGEASAPTKLRGGKTDLMGRPIFVEGISSYTTERDEKSLATVLFKRMEDTATSAIFMKKPNVIEIQEDPSPNFWRRSPNAQFLSTPHNHHDNSNK